MFRAEAVDLLRYFEGGSFLYNFGRLWLGSADVRLRTSTRLIDFTRSSVVEHAERGRRVTPTITPVM